MQLVNHLILHTVILTVYLGIVLTVGVLQQDGLIVFGGSAHHTDIPLPSRLMDMLQKGDTGD